MKTRIRVLYVVSTLYITVPFVLFAFGWLKLPFALSIGICFLYFLYRLIRGSNNDDYFVISRKELGATVLLLIIWTVLSGAGHWGIEGDGYKHNAIFNDLITLSWPVTYLQFKSKELVYLCYYIAYYLPAAAMGRLFGQVVAHIVLFVWTLGGVTLALSWLLSLYNPPSRKSSILRLKDGEHFPLRQDFSSNNVSSANSRPQDYWSFKKGNKGLISFLFILFGGLDALGRFILRNKVVNGSDWEWWARNWQYSGNTTLLFYVPQHVLIGWLMSGILMYSLLNKKPFPLFLVLVSCAPLWSPFVFLGLAPFVCIYVYQNRKTFSISEWFISVVFIIYQVLFFASSVTLITKETHVSAWLWQIEKITHSLVLLRLFLFYLFEFGLFALIIFLFNSHIKNLQRKIILIASAIILLFLPWYKMGLMNDFVMRVSIPSLFIIGFFWIETLVQMKYNRWVRYVFPVLFIVGSIYPLLLLINGGKNISFKIPSTSLTTYQDPVYRKQYLGQKESIFFTYFVRTSSASKKGIMKYK